MFLLSNSWEMKVSFCQAEELLCVRIDPVCCVVEDKSKEVRQNAPGR